MFTTTSSIHLLKSALVDRFTADAAVGGAGASVTFGLPSSPLRALPRDWVAVGNTHPTNATDGAPLFGGGQSTANMAPNMKREERYTLECMVSVLRGPLEDQRAVNAISFGYSAAIETSLRTWQKQGTACDGIVRWCLVGDLWHADGVNPGGDRFCNVFITLDIANRLD